MNDGPSTPADKPPPSWNGREVKLVSVGLGVFKAARKMPAEEQAFHILIHAARYADDSKRVFENMTAIDEVPNRDSYKLLALAYAAAKFNAPPKEEEPVPLD